jgi:hypothetical protein
MVRTFLQGRFAHCYREGENLYLHHAPRLPREHRSWSVTSNADKDLKRDFDRGQGYWSVTPNAQGYWSVTHTRILERDSERTRILERDFDREKGSKGRDSERSNGFKDTPKVYQEAVEVDSNVEEATLITSLSRQEHEWTATSNNTWVCGVTWACGASPPWDYESTQHQTRANPAPNRGNGHRCCQLPHCLPLEHLTLHLVAVPLFTASGARTYAIPHTPSTTEQASDSFEYQTFESASV